MNDTTTYTTMDTPIGKLLLVRTRAGLTAIHFEGASPAPAWSYDPAGFADVVTQLQEYFDGQRFTFDVPLAPQGTPFQLAVWRALCEIPYGATISYGELARRIGKPDAVRAVGAANGKNPIPIIVPCHRVIGSNGTLTGYAGGLAIKAALLDLERRALSPQLRLF